MNSYLLIQKINASKDIYTYYFVKSDSEQIDKIKHYVNTYKTGVRNIYLDFFEGSYTKDQVLLFLDKTRNDLQYLGTCGPKYYVLDDPNELIE